MSVDNYSSLWERLMCHGRVHTEELVTQEILHTKFVGLVYVVRRTTHVKTTVESFDSCI